MHFASVKPSAERLYTFLNMEEERSGSKRVEKEISPILEFKNETENLIRGTYRTRSTNAIIVFHRLLENPYTTIDQVASLCGITFTSASTLVKLLVKDGLLFEITGQSRNRLFVCEQYLNLFR